MSETESGATDSTQGSETEQVEQKVDATDWKAKAREWEKRAKENKSAADRLAEIEEANKTEAQKAADRLAAAEKDAASARSEALRLRVAAKFGIGDEDADLFLTGTDEETLTKQATRLTARESERKKQGNHVAREGTQTSAATSDERELARSLFSGE